MKKYMITVVILICILIAGLYAFIYRERFFGKPVTLNEMLAKERDDEYQRLMDAYTSDTNEYSWTVYLNPVAGGEDKGHTCGSLTEANITLAIAKYVMVMNQDKDLRIVLSRDTDTNPTNEQRMNIFNASKADMIIELRVKSDIKTRVAGIETWYDDSYYNYKLSNSQFADIMCRDIMKRCECQVSGVYLDDENSYGILSISKNPALVLYCGNMENPEEKAGLSGDAYLANMALGILDAIEECRANF